MRREPTDIVAGRQYSLPSGNVVKVGTTERFGVAQCRYVQIVRPDGTERAQTNAGNEVSLLLVWMRRYALPCRGD